MSVDAKTMAVVMAVKQSIETSQNPGLSVNAHPNAFFLKLIGDVDLLRIARNVLASLEAHEAGVKARFESRVSKLASDLNAELKAGAADVEAAFAAVREKLKEKYSHTEEEEAAAFKRLLGSTEKSA